ncbi:transcriptional regulator [Paucilactobacillus hokkaidonensis JCM 18461]|uniref:Transcriptional regulator n=2 Tax=Paucilactobacillus hokkaidonensis TaxID=1193095 RepID=A0A0A1GR86_9LACO|nr:LCP family protein [Paucilactobacillus hokkaidonensis]KRO08792.1 transcriptional regulator [Paucilactobacillus hokkaidonensis]BAP84812.1 transcriptional regulator [Paucilactobacillus hokkaidonensis JCM 18461]
MSADKGDEIKRHKHHRHHHRHHRVRNTILIIVGLLVVVGGVFAAIAWKNLASTTNDMYQSSGADKQRNASKVLSDKKPVSILLLGTDTGDLGRDDKGRTDTIIVMTINPKTKKTTMTSLPRDMKVNLPDYPQYSPAKINAAYAYGGIKETINTVQTYLKVPIDYYVLVNMGGLKKAINQVGGVNVTSPLTFSYNGSSFTEGKSEHMNGETALNFSRMRHEDPQGDYGRQTRQRLVITALLRESISYKTVLNTKFLNSISSQSKTDLTKSQMTKLALSYRNADKTVKSDHAQGTSQMIGGQSFEVVSSTEKQRVSNVIRDNLGLKRVQLTE